MNQILRHTVPNSLSAIRLALGLALPWIPVPWRLAVVIVAAATDAFDGLAARWLRAESDAGRLLDPIADKVFVLMLIGLLLAEGSLNPIWAVGLALRDLAVVIGLAILFVRGKTGERLRPSWLGKATTAAQFVVLLLIVGDYGAPSWLLAATTVLSAAAAVSYGWKTLKK
jgi:CDP-diacylglycerol---glycerol-3-phosphate 3-phosphatidyltransferase